MGNNNTLDINEILRLIPHRYPFVFIDKIIDMVPGEQITAIKNVTINEPFFNGHFPGSPIMPGVIILEAMCQAGCFSLLHSMEDPLKTNLHLSQVEKLKLRKPVIPGDQLKFVVRLIKRKLKACKFYGEVFVDDTLVAEATFIANLTERAGT
jgi:beta-hydroxyacyl-ACP dehydratase FabZ